MTGTAAEAMALHSLEEIVSGNISLTDDNVELYDNQDLGLVYYAGHELPETGGCGTIIYMVSGLLLLAAALCGYIIKRRREGMVCK